MRHIFNLFLTFGALYILLLAGLLEPNLSLQLPGLPQEAFGEFYPLVLLGVTSLLYSVLRLVAARCIRPFVTLTLCVGILLLPLFGGFLLTLGEMLGLYTLHMSWWVWVLCGMGTACAAIPSFRLRAS